MGFAVVGAAFSDALIIVGTAQTITGVACVAIAGEAARRVGAGCIRVAVVAAAFSDALVVVSACESNARVTDVTHTGETATCIGAGGIGVAVVSFFGTLVDVSAGWCRGYVVRAKPRRRITTITVVCSTFVDVCTLGAVAIGV